MRMVIRSTAGYFFILDLLTPHPGHLVADHCDQPILVNGHLPTNELAFSHFSAGLAIDAILGEAYSVDYGPGATTITSSAYFLRTPYCLSNAITNLVGGLAWLHAQETLCLRWKEALVVQPADGPSLGLPRVSVWCSQSYLLKQNPCSPVLGMLLFSIPPHLGYRWGTWLDCLCANLGPKCDPGACYILCHETGRQGTSHYYCQTFLYPFLGTLSLASVMALQVNLDVGHRPTSLGSNLRILVRLPTRKWINMDAGTLNAVPCGYLWRTCGRPSHA
jgi:hypothetical protein